MSVERHELHEREIGAYLLGALSDEEHTRFVRHLAGCHVCRDEVDRLQPAVDALPRSVTPVAAPAGLKAAVMGVVEADVAERSPRPAGLLARLGRRAAALGRARPRAATAGAVALLLVGLLGGFGISRLASDGGGQRTVAAHFDAIRAPHASGNLVIGDKNADAGGTLRVHGMPSLPARQTYQVWLSRDGEMIPKALFSVGSDGNGLTAVDGKLGDAQAVLVTREPAGGSRSPTGRPVLTVKL